TFFQLVAALEYFEDELAAFFAVFVGECGQVFHGRGFERFEAVAFVNLFYNADDIISFSDIGGQKITHSASRICLAHKQIVYTAFARFGRCAAGNSLFGKERIADGENVRVIARIYLADVHIRYVKISVIEIYRVAFFYAVHNAAAEIADEVIPRALRHRNGFRGENEACAKLNIWFDAFFGAKYEPK